MKRLMIAIAIMILASCSKPTTPIQSGVLYYRIQQVDLDGTKTYTPVRRIKVESVASATSDEDDDDEDEDENEHGHCTPLAINFTTFTVHNVKNGIQVNWEADNEQNVSHYIIERSIDTKNWVGRLNYVSDLSGKYTITDTHD